MAINPIAAVKGPPPPINPAAAGHAVPVDKSDKGFVGMLEHALGNLNDLAQNADSVASRAAAGEDVDLHQVVLAMESAGLGFQLALQVRNKLVEAYQEISRMQV